MGKSEIRYAAKVDLEKDAATQPQLHVSGLALIILVPHKSDNLTEPLAPRQYELVSNPKYELQLT